MKNKELVVNTVDDDVEKLFENSPAETDILVELPSKGKFYKGFKQAKVKPLTFEDEQKILLSRNAGADPVNDILEKCVEGVTVQELLSMDKIYLLMKIREVSYGENYIFSYPCPKCNENNNVTINIPQIPVNRVEDDLEDPKDVFLPMLKVVAKVRMPRNFELHYLDDVEDSIANTYRFVTSIADNDNIMFIQKVIKKMHIKDRKVISEAISASKYGIESQFQFVCANCNHSQIMGVPFTSTFFSVT